MKIGAFSIPEIPLGKHNVKDPRLDQVDKLVKAKKKTYVQVELVGTDSILEADAVIALSDNRADLILSDLEFVETRLSRATEEPEKALLNRLKGALEKEAFISSIDITPQEQQFTATYNLITDKPIIVIQKQDIEDLNSLFLRVLKESGFVSFFTAGEKETRAWLIKKGASAWDASGEIHSDIQKGFIRAEIISFQDYIASGGEIPAKQAGKMRLEQKDYIMQDCDLANFRFNK